LKRNRSVLKHKNNITKILQNAGKEISYQSIVDTLPDMVSIINKDYTVGYTNKNAAKMFKISLPEIAGKRLSQLFPENVYKRMKSNLQAVFNTGMPIYAEAKTSFPDSELWLDTWLVPLRDNAGEVDSVLVVSRDITERKKSEDELFVTTQTLQSVFEASPIAIVVMNTEGRVMMWNKSAAKIFGWSEQEVKGKPLPFVPEEKQEEFRLLRKRVIKGESFTGIELIRRKKDGSPIEISLSAAPVYDRLGKVNGIVGMITDITEHKQMVNALRETEAKFRDLAEKSLVGVYVIQDNKLNYANPKLAEIFGYSYEDLFHSKTVLEFVAEEDRLRITDYLHKLINGEMQNLHITLKGLKKNGEIFDVEVYSSGTVHNGKPAVIGTVIDITMRKKIEEQLRQSQKLEAIGRLAGGIAHDFNNILTIILLNCANILHGPKGYSLDGIREIQKASERAARLTSQLLSFARRQIIEPQIVNINDLIYFMDSMLQRVIGENIELKTVYGEDSLNIKIDPVLLEQVILNLVLNARDAMPDGGLITIETAKDNIDNNYIQKHFDHPNEEYIMITVSDTGMGIDENTCSHIFEPFFTTKEFGKGVGLGLATTYGFIKQSGGHIEVHSKVNKGTTFKIYFPKANGEPFKYDAPEEILILPSGIETVLLVEDESSVRELIGNILRKQGYTVLEYKNGEDAINFVKGYSGKIDLLLADIVMPKMNGRELYEQLKLDRSNIKVLFISGYADNLIINRGFLEENFSLLRKPFAPAKLLSMVRKVLDG